MDPLYGSPWGVRTIWEGKVANADHRIPAEFERRRKRLLWSFGFALVLFALGLVLTQVRDFLPGLLGVSRRGWFVAAMAQMIAGVVLAVAGFQQYRCPVCDQIIRGHDKSYLGVLVNPGKCPECGTRLQE